MPTIVPAFRVISISGNVPVSLSRATAPLAIDDLNKFGFEQDIIDSGYPQVLADLYRGSVPFAGPAALAAMGELQEDLQITTDLRGILAEMLQKRLGGTALGTVFPGYTGLTDCNAFLP